VCCNWQYTFFVYKIYIHYFYCIANSLREHIRIERFNRYKSKFRKWTVANLVSNTGIDAYDVLKWSEAPSRAIPATRIFPLRTQTDWPSVWGVPPTRVFDPDQIVAIRNRWSISPRVEPGSSLDVEKILELQCNKQSQLGDIVEMDESNFWEPPPEWYEIASALERSIVQPEGVSKFHDFSLMHSRVWHDGNGNWYYNFVWAALLAYIYRKTLPTSRQLTLAIERNPEKFASMTGYYDPGTPIIKRGSKCYVHDMDEFSHFWTTTSHESTSSTAHAVVLKRGDIAPWDIEVNKTLYLPIRFINESAGTE
jgi:hypothetical protein